jgi:hypothetical protein
MIKKEIIGYYGDKKNFYILYQDGSRAPARSDKNKRKQNKF